MSSLYRYTKRSAAALGLSIVFAGCAGEVQSAGGPSGAPRDGEPSSSFQTSEFRALSATPQQESCKLSTVCRGVENSKEAQSAACREAAKSCLESIALQTSGPRQQLAACQAARAAAKQGDHRAQAHDDFRGCVRGALQTAAAGVGDR